MKLEKENKQIGNSTVVICLYFSYVGAKVSCHPTSINRLFIMQNSKMGKKRIVIHGLLQRAYRERRRDYKCGKEG